MGRPSEVSRSDLGRIVGLRRSTSRHARGWDRGSGRYGPIQHSIPKEARTIAQLIDAKSVQGSAHRPSRIKTPAMERAGNPIPSIQQWVRPHRRALARQVNPSHPVATRSRTPPSVRFPAPADATAVAKINSPTGAPQRIHPIRPRARSSRRGGDRFEDGSIGRSCAIDDRSDRSPPAQDGAGIRWEIWLAPPRNVRADLGLSTGCGPPARLRKRPDATGPKRLHPLRRLKRLHTRWRPPRPIPCT